jgi:hypothetical protein
VWGGGGMTVVERVCDGGFLDDFEEGGEGE